MEVQQAYTEWSSTYDHDQNLTRDLDEKVTRQALNNLRFKSILEIGCGTGKNTRLLARIGEQVLALDFSEGMIEKARQKLSARNVTFQAADIEQPWPCPDQSVDFITCNLVLEHVRRLTHIFSEAQRTLVAGGRFFVCELHPARQYQGTQAKFKRSDATTKIPAFVHHLSDFLNAASGANLSLAEIREWWHAEDMDKPPRLISFWFTKP